MKFKKINYFGKKTLKKFIIQLIFTEDFDLLDILKTAEFAKNIEEDFGDVPKILLMPKPGEPINLGPLVFRDRIDGNNSFEIGRNFVKFDLSRYEKWEIECKRINRVLTELNKFLPLPEVKDINMTYIDEFRLEKNGFVFGKYFTFPIDPERRWNIRYDDFFLGFVPFQEPDENEQGKLVLRLRTIGQTQDLYIYSLETAYIIKNLLINVSEAYFYVLLERAHDIIVTYFIDFLTLDYKKKLQLDFTEPDN